MNANQIFERGGAVARRSTRAADRLRRRVAGGAFGVVRRARQINRAPKAGMDDVTLARKVETEIFRGPRSPKATVNVDVVDGVVWLRGEVKRPAQIRGLERTAHAVPEVRGVENLVHLPRSPRRSGLP
jgi:osmotically-inducible protein OsmY